MIVIKRRPYELNFSGNSIVYELFDQAAVLDADLTYEVRIVLKRFDSDSEIELANIPLTPFKGTAKVDLQTYLHGELAYDLPDPDDTLPIKGTGIQSASFYIEYRSVSKTNTDPSWNSSEVDFTRIVIKGGIAPFSWNNNSFFTSFYPTSKPFFTWQKNRRLVSSKERIWLSWLNTDYTSTETIKVRIYCHLYRYNDFRENNKHCSAHSLLFLLYTCRG